MNGLRLVLIGLLGVLLLTGIPRDGGVPGDPVGPLVVPGDPPGVALTLPPRLRAGIPAALDVHLAGEPGASGVLAVRGGAGVEASIPLRLDADGRRQLALRVVPLRGGWHQWEATWEADGSRSAHASDGLWVEDAAPIRVLAVGGAPDWEGRDVLRALDEAGVQVDARFALGRGVTVGGEPRFAAVPAEADVVLLLPGATLTPEGSRTLPAWVQGEGGGLILAGTDGDQGLAGRLGFAFGPERSVGTDEWVFPDVPELTPLPAPADPVRVLGTELVSLAASGRGRVAAVHLAESWRWRMGGEAEAHRAFWNDLVAWASGGIRGAATLVPARRVVPVGSRVAVEVVGASDEVIDALRVTPVGGDGSFLLRAPAPPGTIPPEGPTRPHPARTFFLVPLDTGVVHLEALAEEEERPGNEVLAESWVRVVEAERAELADPRGAIEAERSDLAGSGGPLETHALGIVSGAEGPAARARGIAPPAATDREPRSPFRFPRGSALPLLFSLLLAAVLVEWGLRRLRGLP